MLAKNTCGREREGGEEREGREERERRGGEGKGQEDRGREERVAEGELELLFSLQHNTVHRVSTTGTVAKTKR